ncbi:MAG: ATP synthase F0 subunit B [Spirochaetaceae bacterium]|nr:ATP synthase F0 subunit B [Spirochaetaceae bacterium]
MIEINVTLLIQMVSFLVFLFLMNLILYRPIRAMLARRSAFIAEQQGVVDSADAGAVAVSQEISTKIQQARKDGRQKIQDLKAAAYGEEKDLLQKAGGQAAKQIQDMRAEIAKEIGVARDQLRAQVQSFSVELAKKILGRSF